MSYRSHDRRHLQRLCETCGGVTRHAYNYHCQRCDGPRRVMRSRQCGGHTSNATDEIRGWADALDRDRDVTYPLAAAVWDVDAGEAIRRVNAMVCADLLRGIGPGRFAWVEPEKFF